TLLDAVAVVEHVSEPVTLGACPLGEYVITELDGAMPVRFGAVPKTLEVWTVTVRLGVLGGVGAGGGVGGVGVVGVVGVAGVVGVVGVAGVAGAAGVVGAVEAGGFGAGVKGTVYFAWNGQAAPNESFGWI